MSVVPPPPAAFLIPETAPFSSEQRAWLAGFLAAAMAPDAAAVPRPGAETAAVAPGTGPALASNDDAAWHDPALAIGERMALVDGRPLAQRLMAAMAQQDCGQCGYNCADYANAIVLRREARLNLCAPGGKATTRLVKALATEVEQAAAPPLAVAPAPAVPTGCSRDHPVEVAMLSRRRLSGSGSAKDTWHVEFDVAGGDLAYAVGDAFGIFPRNDLGLVDQVIAMLGASHAAGIGRRTLRDVLSDEVSLGVPPDSLFELLSYVSGGRLRDKARALARAEDPDGDAADLDVLAVLQKFAGVRPHPEAFVEALEPMQPRLYSIASSARATPGRLALTVDAVRYTIGRRQRLGTASTFLAERAAPGAAVRAYIQKAQHFRLPDDPALPVIMVGPGTGIAPFRAFLQERQALGAPGANWLFFGHQHQDTDFFYREELQALQRSKLLTRLSLAWSRDAAAKFYVQDRMREVGAELWQWLARGAHFYVCGDARRMAKDVEAALVEIVAVHGARPADKAVEFVRALKKAGRYQADVY